MSEIAQNTLKAVILYDVNAASFKDGPELREITIRVDVSSADDCARAVSLLSEKLANHLVK